MTASHPSSRARRSSLLPTYIATRTRLIPCPLTCMPLSVWDVPHPGKFESEPHYSVCIHQASNTSRGPNWCTVFGLLGPSAPRHSFEIWNFVEFFLRQDFLFKYCLSYRFILSNSLFGNLGCVVVTNRWSYGCDECKALLGILETFLSIRGYTLDAFLAK